MSISKRPLRALIVGANGQDGRIISGLLLRKNFDVFGVTKRHSGSKKVEEGVTEIQVDLSDPKIFSKVMNRVMPDYILHFGAVHSNSKEMQSLELTHSDEMYQCHVEITRNVLEWQRSNNCNSLIALSSLIFTPTFPQEEIFLNHTYEPQNLYGRTKLEAMQLILDYRRRFEIKTAGLILFNHSSEFTKSKFLIPTIASKIVSSRNSRLPIRILQSQQLIDISSSHSFCIGFLKIIERNVFEDLIFSSGKMRSLQSLYVDAILRINPNLISRFEFDDSGADIPSMFGNIDETRSLLDWEGGGDPVQIIEKIYSLQNG